MTPTGYGDLPGPGDRRVAVRVSPDALRHVRSGHPWLFDRSITSLSHEGAPGDLAVVFDDRRRFAAIGLYDPASPIRVRILHNGAPTPIDQDFWHERISAAADVRGPLLARDSTNCYRVVHGENDGLPGLVVDRYAHVAVIKIYSGAWFAHLGAVIEAVVAVHAPMTIVLRLSRQISKGHTYGLHDGQVITGPPVELVTFQENGLTFTADPVAGQKTGHFIDQRDNRALVRRLSRGARVLDLFCCTGGFGVHAAAGGASAIHSVDLSTHAIESTELHFELNHADHNVADARRAATIGDAFGVLGHLAESRHRYDMVIVDPPSFAAKAADVEKARRAYRRLTQAALAVTAPGGTLVQASCSSRIPDDEFFAGVHAAATDCGVELNELVRTGHALDHPIGFPEGAYLKALFATADY